MKKMNNKGFSLVELIIVIAIMAVLMGVLAPQLIKYVEESRTSADGTTLDEIENAVKIALAQEDVYQEVGTKGVTIGIAVDGTISGGGTEMMKELNAVITEKKELTSNTLGKQAHTVKVEYVTESKSYKITNSWDAILNPTGTSK